MTVPVEGTWEGPTRPTRPNRPSRPSRDAGGGPLRPVVVDRRDLDGGGVAVPLRAMPRWAPFLLLVVGVALIGLFVAAVVSVVRGPVRAAGPVGLVVLGLFALLGAAFLAAVPSTVRASRAGRRWLLTPAQSSSRVLALGDTRYLGVDPEALARAVALLAARPELRERLVDERGVRLVETGSA